MGSGRQPGFRRQPGANGVGTKKVTADLSAFLIDITASYQLGPLLLELRGDYSTGNTARANLAKGIRHFQPLATDGIYYAGWAQMMALGVDYFNGVSMAGMGQHIGYDRYGRAQFGLRATYTFTPAALGLLHREPDVDGGEGRHGHELRAVPAAVGLTSGRTTVSQNSWTSGDSSYVGTEANLGIPGGSPRTRPSTLSRAGLFAGAALDTAECNTGTPTCRELVKKDAKDAYTLAARVRLAF